MNRRLGWKPDRLDHRDHVYAAPKTKRLPKLVDLRPQFTFPVYDQGEIGSCTANAIAAAVQFDLVRQQLPSFTPSRLFIYYRERAMEKSIPFDAGAEIRDGIKSINVDGVPPETMWPYDDTPADEKTERFPKTSRAIKAPTAKVVAAAKLHRSLSYQRLTAALPQLKGCLADGFPFVFGISIMGSFYDKNDEPLTTIPMPKSTEEPLGGHAILAVGYDDDKRLFIIRNSWGEDSQDGGYFYLPYDYVTNGNLSDDFWTIRIISG